MGAPGGWFAVLLLAIVGAVAVQPTILSDGLLGSIIGAVTAVIAVLVQNASNQRHQQSQRDDENRAFLLAIYDEVTALRERFTGNLRRMQEHPQVNRSCFNFSSCVRRSWSTTATSA